MSNGSYTVSYNDVPEEVKTELYTISSLFSIFNFCGCNFKLKSLLSSKNTPFSGLLGIFVVPVGSHKLHKVFNLVNSKTFSFCTDIQASII